MLSNSSFASPRILSRDAERGNNQNIPEEEMINILKNYNKEAQAFCTKSVDANWQHNVDLDSDEKQAAAVRKLLHIDLV